MTTSGGRPWRSQTLAWPGSGTRPQRCQRQAPTPGWPPRSSSLPCSQKAVTSGGMTITRPRSRGRHLFFFFYLHSLFPSFSVTFSSPLCLRVIHQLRCAAVGAPHRGGSVPRDRRPGRGLRRGSQQVNSPHSFHLPRTLCQAHGRWNKNPILSGFFSHISQC